MHFNRYIAYWSRWRGEAPILHCEDEVLSWAGFAEATGTLAAFLARRGVVPGDRVGCLLGNSIAWCVGFGAAMRLGATCVPFNAVFGSFELSQIARDADCRAILSCPSQIVKLDPALVDSDMPDEPRLYFPGTAAKSVAYAQIIADPQPWIDGQFPDSDVLAICYTSGTTGVPKGAMLTHRNVEAMAQGLFLNCGMRGGDERFLILAPLGFTGGVISNLSPMIMIGGTGILEKSVDPARALRLLTEHRVTAFGGVPALWERVAAAPGFDEADISTLRMAVTGGAPVPRALLDRYLSKGVAIRQQYGFTEACGCVATYDAKGAVAFPNACGFPTPGMDIEIRDETGQRTGPGEVGELCARGEQLMRGYWCRPDLTAEAIVDGWYHTGDLGVYAEDGAIRVVDRKKNMLISGGMNIYPAEVERAMYCIDGIAEVVVLGIDSPKWGQEAVAIVYAPERDDPAAIIRAARDLLGAYKAPKHVALSPEPLPRTASGKITRAGLGDLFARLAPGVRGQASVLA